MLVDEALASPSLSRTIAFCTFDRPVLISWVCAAVIASAKKVPTPPMAEIPCVQPKAPPRAALTILEPGLSVDAVLDTR